jgi:ABC-2 type transport system ATP-binding protein
MIETTDLRKVFGPIVAVDRLSMTVEKGEVLGFLGPNGAGKSTTMKMITGFLTPSSGRASVCGHDVGKATLAAQRAIGYLPEGAPAYPDMTPESFLRFAARTRGLIGRDAKAKIASAADLVQLHAVMRQPIETLSKGFKRRVGLAQAILHDPAVLILDEPTDGLDPNQKHEVRELIRRMAGEKCVVLSTHILEEVDAVCTRAVVVARGTIVADETPGALRARAANHNAVTLVVKGDQGGLVEALRNLKGVARIDDPVSADGVFRCRVLATNGSEIAPAVAQLVRDRGLTLERLGVEQGKLDEVFREITLGDRTSNTKKTKQEAAA